MAAVKQPLSALKAKRLSAFVVKFCLCGQIASAAGSSHRNDGSWLLLHILQHSLNGLRHGRKLLEMHQPYTAKPQRFFQQPLENGVFSFNRPRSESQGLNK